MLRIRVHLTCLSILVWVRFLFGWRRLTPLPMVPTSMPLPELPPTCCPTLIITSVLALRDGKLAELSHEGEGPLPLERTSLRAGEN